MEPNGDGKLIVEYKNTMPIELRELTNSLASIANEYEEFAYSDSELDGAWRKETRLYVHKIRSGSIITELIPLAPALLPILSEINTVVGFTKHVKTVFEVLLGANKEEKSKLKTQTLENVRSVVEPVANDHSSQLVITGDVNFNAPVTVVLGTNDARSLTFAIGKELEDRRKAAREPHKKVVMHWYQARNDASSKAGDRAIIESIWPKPVKVIFESDKAKYKILKMKDNLFDHAFLVDVQVETVLKKPTLYKIVAFHKDLGRRELPVRKARTRRRSG